MASDKACERVANSVSATAEGGPGASSAAGDFNRCHVSTIAIPSMAGRRPPRLSKRKTSSASAWLQIGEGLGGESRYSDLKYLGIIPVLFSATTHDAQ